MGRTLAGWDQIYCTGRCLGEMRPASTNTYDKQQNHAKIHYINDYFVPHAHPIHRRKTWENKYSTNDLLSRQISCTPLHGTKITAALCFIEIRLVGKTTAERGKRKKLHPPAGKAKNTSKHFTWENLNEKQKTKNKTKNWIINWKNNFHLCVTYLLKRIHSD